ncbi:MAG: DNA/RNA non-specific endonuclease, partial [Anaerolineales bacterium]|nr:DNA/RNA non-specific endonuclease [Anaerolineales bacterium]
RQIGQVEGPNGGGGEGPVTAQYGGDREAEPNLTAHYLDDPPPTITIANGHKSVKDPTFLPYGELAPGTRFRRNDYLYQTDDQGRVISVTGQLGAQAHPRYPYYERVVGNSGGIATDDGGHLVASRFGGVSEGVNLVPMNAALNRAGGDWYRMEQRWAAALERGERVEVNIRPIYEGVSDRPARFVVDYWIDGRPFTIEFDNTLER